MLKRNDNIIKHKMMQYILPGIMQIAALQIGNIVDTMLVGNILGSDAMSAVKVGMAIDNIVEIPGHVLGVGGSVAVGILFGNRETEKAKRVFTTTFTVSVLLGIIFALFAPFSGYFANFLCGGSSLVDDAKKFIFVTLLIAPIFSAALQMINYVAVDSNAKLSSIYVITANVINLTFDYILLKYTKLGTAGAALSTGLGYGLALFLMIFYVKSKKRMLSFVNPFGDMFNSLLLAIKAGVPSLLYIFFLTVKDMSLNSMIVRMVGETAMAIYTVCSNTNLCVQMFAGGIVGLFSSMGSVLYGKRDFFGIKKLIRYLLRYSYIVLSIFMIVMLVKPEIFFKLFGITDMTILTYGITALRIYTVSLPFYLWNHFMMTYYQSTEKTVLSSLITSLQTCIVIVPLAFIFVSLATLWGINNLNAIMLAFVFSEILTLLIVYVYQKIKYKNQNYFMIPKKDVDRQEFTITGKNEEMKEMVSEIFAYCESRNISKYAANRMAVVAEEIANNIFKCANAKHIDIAIDVLDKMIQLRLTDDGKIFNPLEYDNEVNSKNAKDVEIIKKIANHLEYLRVIDLNYTSIEVKMDVLNEEK